MPGNSQRKGAMRKGASRKGPAGRHRRPEAQGPAGQGPDAQGRGPREAHRGQAQARRRAPRGRADQGRSHADVRRSARRSAAGPPGAADRQGEQRGRRGRNTVVEALRAEIPVTAMYVASRIDTDDRVKESLKIATARGLNILETPRGELDRLTDGAIHQGLALQVPPYEYAHPERPARRGGRRRAAGADRGPRRGDRPAQPRCRRPVRGRVRRSRRDRARAAGGRDDRRRLEDLGRRGGPAAGGAGHQPDPGAGVVAAGRVLRRRPGHGRRHRAARPGRWRTTRWCSWSAPRARACPGWCASVRHDRVDPDARRHRVAQRRRRRRGRALRGRPAASPRSHGIGRCGRLGCASSDGCPGRLRVAGSDDRDAPGCRRRGWRPRRACSAGRSRT